MMERNPELSIIIPVYNSRQWLAGCIGSVLSQTFTDWEMILIDDGSDDGSGLLCDEFASRDTRIKVIHKANEGVCAARNTALDIIRGEFFTYIDSDDELGVPTTLEENIRILEENPDIDIVQFPWSIIRNGIPCKQWWSAPDKIMSTKAETITSLSRFELTYQVWQKIYRSGTLKDVRFPAGMKVGEDGWYMTDILARARKVRLSTSGMYSYMERENSATRIMNAEKMRDEFKMSYKLFMRLCTVDGVTDSARNQYFYTVVGRMCIAQAAGNYAFQEELHELKKHIPGWGQLFHRMKKKHKWYLIQTRLFGLDFFVRKTTGMKYCR